MVQIHSLRPFQIKRLAASRPSPKPRMTIRVRGAARGVPDYGRAHDGPRLEAARSLNLALALN